MKRKIRREERRGEKRRGEEKREKKRREERREEKRKEVGGIRYSSHREPREGNQKKSKKIAVFTYN